MQHGTIKSSWTLAAAALLLVAAAGASTALFQAAAPGQDLFPVDGADKVIQILQGQKSILWTTLDGSVGSIVTQGWPTTVGDSELGGAMTIERPSDGTAGVISFGEKPMSVEFETTG
jgi:hypothetical protein